MQAEAEAAAALRRLADELEHLVRAADALRAAILEATMRVESALTEISKVVNREE